MLVWKAGVRPTWKDIAFWEGHDYSPKTQKKGWLFHVYVINARTADLPFLEHAFPHARW